MNHDQLKERMYNRTVLSDDESCWLWLGYTTPRGYGQIKVNGKVQRASRVSYTIHIGPIPTGLHVLHTCDNPSCVNPHHLFVGTHADNMADRSRKGRTSRGEQRPSSKLTDDMVREIFTRKEQGERQCDIAASYGVHPSIVTTILSGQSWAHIYREQHKEN